MSSCANCNKTLKKKPGDTGFYRFSLENALPSTGINARVQLEKMTGQPLTPVAKKLHGRFLCPQCWSKVNTSSKYEQASKEFFSETLDESYIASKRPSAETVSSPGTSFKRPRFTSTPLKHKPKTARSIFGRSGPPPSKWDTIITAIRARQYRRAIKGLYKASPATKRHFIAVATMIVRKEVKTILKERKTFPLAKEVNIPSIQDFSWEKTLAMAEQSTPLLLGVLKGAVTKKSNEKSMVRGSRVQLKPKLGTAMALLLHARSPQICKFLPTLFSVQFWRGRLKRETMDQMSRLGICVSPNAALSAIDKIRSDFDAAALLLKEKMEKVLLSNLSVNVQENHELSVALCQSVANIEDEITVLPDKEFDDTILYSEAEDTTLSSKYPYDELEIDIDVNDDDDDDDDDDEKCGSEEDDDDDDDDKDDDDEDEATHYDVIDAGEGGVEQRYGTDDVNLPVSEEMGENSEVMIEESMEFEVSGMDEPAPTHPFGYTMCWDNVGKKVVTRRPNENVKNKYINMALGYLAVNRVPNPHISIDSNNVLKASNIPVLSFIPGNEEFSKLKNRMQVLVGRILVRHIPWFRDNFSQFSIPHIVHDHTIESTYKTLLVNLGVFNEEPSSTQGAIGIYTKLQNYVPVVNGTPCPVVVYGDGLSCERGNDAQCARTNGLDPMERLEGLEPAAQEFHKEMLLLQDFFDDFFKGSSASERGTVSQVKNMFNYRQVKADISDNFSHAWELMCLLTEAYTCLLVMDNEGIPPDGSQPAAAPDDLLDGTDDVKYAYFEKACQDIVNNAWHKLDTDLLKLDDGSGPAVFCCGEDIDEELIGCECRSNCPKGEFFHYTCAGVDPANIVAPWYCSEDCRNRVSSGYQYCTCKQDLGTNEPMIGCSAEGMCTNAEWYHMRCLGIDPKKKQKREWYCSDECKKQRKKKTSTARKDFTVSHDSKRSYSLALLWRGLNLLCRRDAVREADGETMMAFWKIDLVHFFGNRHPKYTILAHRLIASINGWASQRIKHDLIHNRTVNYGGGIGRNLPLDFMNEILNRLFKDLLESAKGRYTDTTVNRCSQIVGPLGESLDMVFDTNVVENEIYRHRRRAVSRDGNVSRLIEFLYEENLFRSVPGRKHVAFQNFAYSETPKLAGKFVSKMKQLSKKLDRRRAAILDS